VPQVRAKLRPAPAQRRRQAGQALTEYVLLLVVATGLAVSILLGFKPFLRNTVQAFNATLENDLETCNLGQNGSNEAIWNQD
jgi:hypothetical protein